MEPQPQEFGVATAQQLMRGAVGEDELARLVRLDHGDGNGVQGFEQAAIRGLRHLLNDVQLIRRAGVAHPVGDGEPDGDDRRDIAEARQESKHQGPVDLAFEEHQSIRLNLGLTSPASASPCKRRTGEAET